MTKTLLTNVNIYDGTGHKPFLGDVLLAGEKIARVATGRALTDADANTIDGTGLALAPGFIDTHSHSDLEVFRNPALMHATRQGITTELIGQDGSSVAPVSDGLLSELADNLAPLAGRLERPFWWRSYGEYLTAAQKISEGTRIEGLVGHGTIRMCVMGNDNRPPNSTELDHMRSLLAESLSEGARGLSLGLIYPPGSYADTPELVEMAKVVAKYDGILMVHMRNEQDKLLPSLDEMGFIARESGVRLHISHLKVLGKPNWGVMTSALARIDEMISQGLDVTFDQYPYIAACTGLKVLVPPEAYAGGEQAFQGRIKDRSAFKEILAGVRRNLEIRGGPENVLIASVASEENSWMASQTLGAVAARMGLDPGEAVLSILRQEGPAVVAIYFSLSEDDVSLAMRHHLHGVCTDGIMGGHPHPRTYGSFPRVLGYYCREKRLFPLEEAIRKMTMEPARRLRLWDRGLIREGMAADLVLFDPVTIQDTNTFVNPKSYPVGIKGVWVNGVVRFGGNNESD